MCADGVQEGTRAHASPASTSVFVCCSSVLFASRLPSLLMLSFIIPKSEAQWRRLVDDAGINTVECTFLAGSNSPTLARSWLRTVYYFCGLTWAHVYMWCRQPISPFFGVSSWVLSHPSIYCHIFIILLVLVVA